MGLSGCGSHHTPKASAPTTTLVKVDTWTAPVVSGPASPANYCALVVSLYKHEQDLEVAAGTKLKEQIVTDYVKTVPKIVTESPPAIASAAKLYFDSTATILGQLVQNHLNAQKNKGSGLALLLDPAVKTAGNQVIAYTGTNCHYTIGG